MFSGLDAVAVAGGVACSDECQEEVLVFPGVIAKVVWCCPPDG